MLTLTTPTTTQDSETGVVAYIGLGSNIGDRLSHLRRACQEIARIPGVYIEAGSTVYASESVEGGGEGDFMNAALRIRTHLSAPDLLTALLAVEATLGRPMPPRGGPRIIDLDLLLYGEAEIHLPHLTVPHPRLPYRRFVLRPLCDVLIGGWIQPTGETLPGNEHEPLSRG